MEKGNRMLASMKKKGDLVDAFLEKCSDGTKVKVKEKAKTLSMTVYPSDEAAIKNLSKYIATVTGDYNIKVSPIIRAAILFANAHLEDSDFLNFFNEVK